MLNSRRLLRICLLVAGVLWLVGVAEHGPSPARAAFLDTDGDRAIDIAEAIVGSDPNDPDSFPESTGAAALSGLPLCADGVDNDADGLTDGADPGCVDSDLDLASNPTEALLGSDPVDPDSFPEDARLDAVLDFFGRHEILACSDGVDNDLDGLIDEADPGCAAIDGDGDGFDDVTEKRFRSGAADPASTPEHEIPNPGSCSDAIDNDLDGLVDAADPACAAPSNDDRGSAAPAEVLPFSDSVKVLDATLEAEEPQPACVVEDVTRTVWYQFTPADNVLLTADTVGSDYDTVLAVRRQDEPAVEVACNDNFFGINVVQSGLAFQAMAGETYLFQVGSVGQPAGAGTLTFNLELGAPLPNDDKADALAITSLPFQDGPLSLRFATLEEDEPISTCHFGGVFSTVWYRIAPETDASLLADATGSDFATVLAVWTEGSLGLAEVACNNDFGQQSRSSLAFSVVGGREYLIQVTHLTSAFGPPTALGLTFRLSSSTVGDADCNGDVNSIDAALVLQVVAGLVDSLACPENGDANASGTVDSVDAALILQLGAGLIETLPP